MGLLAPLYIAGLLGIGIPILLHLIRRTPQGRQLFSSLMFLSPSPPRLTRRSRLSNILLLLLRAAVVTLLALAFARPFFNTTGNEDKQASSGRRILFLVDTSASMRRPDLWADAKKQVDKQLDEIAPADEVGLYFFDRDVHEAMSFAQWNQADPAQRLPLFRSALAQASPGWSATRLGDALAQAADRVSENNSQATDLKKSRTIVLVTDMQEGAKPEALQGHEWPKDVTLKKLSPVIAKTPGNASVQWTQGEGGGGGAPGTAGQGDGSLRVRVVNEADSTKEQFTLTWANDKGPLPNVEPVQVYVPPGRSQIVKLSLPSDGTPDRLVLSGDDCDFDNTLYIVPPQAQTLRLVYLGDDDVKNLEGELFYLRSALFDTPLRKVEITAKKKDEPLAAGDLNGARLTVVARPPSDAELASLKQYVQAGGDVLWVGWNAETTQRAGAFIGTNLQVAEAANGNVGPAGAGSRYALLNRIEMSDPVFAPFADARFSDFTKIHFWKHREVKWDTTDKAGGPQVRATFDDGFPYMLWATLPPQANAKAGNIYLLTSGWSPLESQMALSSKFLPILEQLVRRTDAFTLGGQYLVNETISLPASATAGGGGGGQMLMPNGKTEPVAGSQFPNTTQPGIYHWKTSSPAAGGAGNQDIAIAVNLSPDESRTKPGTMDDLAQWGVKFTTPESLVIAAERQRILQTGELENKQKTWRWILLAVLGLLVIETALAGRLSRGSRGASTQGAAT